MDANGNGTLWSTSQKTENSGVTIVDSDRKKYMKISRNLWNYGGSLILWALKKKDFILVV